MWEHSRPQIELLGWSPTSSPHTLTSVSRLAMPTVLSLVLSLFAIFLVQLLLRLRKVVRSFRSVCFPSPSRPIWSTSGSRHHFGSNLSGPFFLFRPDSVPGQLVMRIARPVPYLNMGKTWLLSKKYEGTGPLTIVRGNAIREVFLFSIDFAAAGQDVAALVISLRIL